MGVSYPLGISDQQYPSPESPGLRLSGHQTHASMY